MMEYTGAESYVWSCMEKRSNRSWIPARHFFEEDQDHVQPLHVSVCVRACVRAPHSGRMASNTCLAAAAAGL
jgi:hypothetical protein